MVRRRSWGRGAIPAARGLCSRAMPSRAWRTPAALRRQCRALEPGRRPDPPAPLLATSRPAAARTPSALSMHAGVHPAQRSQHQCPGLRSLHANSRSAVRTRPAHRRTAHSCGTACAGQRAVRVPGERTVPESSGSSMEAQGTRFMPARSNRSSREIKEVSRARALSRLGTGGVPGGILPSVRRYR